MNGKRGGLDLQFVGAATVEPEGLAPTGARVTYFGSAETTGLSTFSSVVYPELWPGIDLQFNALGDSVKYELIVRPGADPSAIRLRWNGSQGVRLEPNGALSVLSPVRTITDPKPVSFQEIDGRRTPVASAYDLAPGSTEHGFALGAYDPSRTLVIDPVLLQGVTFVGGSLADEGFSVTLDDLGYIYLGGRSASPADDFLDGAMAGLPSFDNTLTGHNDAFIVKMNPTATQGFTQATSQATTPPT